MYPCLYYIIKQRLIFQSQMPRLGVINNLLKLQIGQTVPMFPAKAKEVISYLTSGVVSHTEIYLDMRFLS